MAAYYRAFGLTFQSSEPLPWLPETMAADRVDVRIEVDRPLPPPAPEPGESLHVRLPGRFETSAPQLTVWRSAESGRFRFRYRDGCQFTVSADGQNVGVARPPGISLEDSATYLLGPITGFLLRLQGRVCLHASAVCDSKNAVGLMAPAGFGKSSAAAMLVRRGYVAMTDDILALERRGEAFFVVPGWPHLRLWPESVSALFGRRDALPRLCPENPSWNKRFLDLSAAPGQYRSDPTPLKVVYSARIDTKTAADRIEALAGAESLKMLLANSYSWYTLDPDMRAAEFEFLAAMAKNVPLRCLTVGQEAREQLDERCRTICEDAVRFGVENHYSNGVIR